MSISQKFSGHIFIFHAFDVGEEINLDRITSLKLATPEPLSKYFKNYHLPLAIQLPDPKKSPHCTNAHVHGFGVITLRYKIPFNDTLEALREKLNDIEDHYQLQSMKDAASIFEETKSHIKQARFFQLRTSYVIIHVFPTADVNDIVNLKKGHGSTIASLLRFETETLSEYQKNEILASSIGYYRNDLIIIDTDATFMYDAEYAELLDLFEFANMQHLELQYFDRILDKQLSIAYERKVQSPPLRAYLPFVGAMANDPVSELGRLRVDISVISERLENSVKLAGEVYYAELYSLLVEKLDLQNLKDSINQKLSIIQSISNIYQHNMEMIREDILSLSIILLILIEVVLGLWGLFKC